MWLKALLVPVIAMLALTGCYPEALDERDTYPTIFSFTPAAGTEGSTVVITGRNFAAIPADNIVTFNGVAAVVSQASRTELTVVVPSGATTGKITIATNGKTATSATDFIVDPLAPTITVIAPDKGDIGTVVELTGTGFKAGSEVYFGTIKATEVTIVSATKITVKVPAGATTGKIRVLNNSFEALSPVDFYVKPSITSFTPTAGSAGDVVEITGTNFSTVAGENIVRFGTLTVAAADVTVIDGTKLSVTVPAGVVTSKIEVEVKGQVAVSATDFMVMPSVTSVTPMKGDEGSEVTITGSGLTSVTKVFVGSKEATIKAGTTDGQLVFIVPSGYNHGTEGGGAIKIMVGTAEKVLPGTFTVTNIWVKKRTGFGITTNGHRLSATFTYNGKAYVVMGANSGNNRTRKIVIFDPVTNTWSDGPALPAGMPERMQHTVFEHNGKAYVGIGYSNETSGSIKKDWWELDLATSTWRQLTDYPTINGGAIGLKIGDHMYVGFGTGTGSGNNNIYEFDPSGNAGMGSWITKTTHEKRYYGNGFVIGSTGYFGGGTDITGNNSKKFFSLTFPGGVATVTPIADIPVGAGWGGPVGLSFNGRGFVFSDTQVFEYLPSTNSWIERAQLPPSWPVADEPYSAFTIGTRAFAFQPLTGDTYEYNQ
jgi:hypothetical protein